MQSPPDGVGLNDKEALDDLEVVNVERAPLELVLHDDTLAEIKAVLLPMSDELEHKDGDADDDVE